MIGPEAVPSTDMNSQPVVLARNESNSKPGSYHEVRRGADGNVYCTCPSWRFQRNSPLNRTCKHIESWKRNTVVAGVSLMNVLGPGPVAVRAPRKPRAPKVKPVVSVQVHGKSVTIPCPPPEGCSEEAFEEPEWDSRPTAWDRVKSA